MVSYTYPFQDLYCALSINKISSPSSSEKKTFHYCLSFSFSLSCFSEHCLHGSVDPADHVILSSSNYQMHSDLEKNYLFKSIPIFLCSFSFLVIRVQGCINCVPKISTLLAFVVFVISYPYKIEEVSNSPIYICFQNPFQVNTFKLENTS